MVDMLLWLLLFHASSLLYGESFQDVLGKNQKNIRTIVGEKVLKKLYSLSSKNEVYRVTQLKEIDGVGRTSIDKIAELIGVRFVYQIDIDECRREGRC
jgi:hypothetical protein